MVGGTTDDHVAADKFEEVAEAYQVLKDPQLWARYNKDDWQGLLSADKTDVVANTSPNLDRAILFLSFLLDQISSMIMLIDYPWPPIATHDSRKDKGLSG